MSLLVRLPLDLTNPSRNHRIGDHFEKMMPSTGRASSRSNYSDKAQLSSANLSNLKTRARVEMLYVRFLPSFGLSIRTVHPQMVQLVPGVFRILPPGIAPATIALGLEPKLSPSNLEWLRSTLKLSPETRIKENSGCWPHMAGPFGGAHF